MAKQEQPQAADPSTDCGQHIILSDSAKDGSDSLVLVDVLLRDTAVHPAISGPWKDEADKIAWIDQDTGYGCIIRRAAHGGHLGGYVGVPTGHPVFSFEAAALRGLGIRAHGGISYAAECERHENERTTTMDICHEGATTRTVRHTTREGRTVLDMRPHDDLWWVGFECCQPTDVIPSAGEPGTRVTHLPSSPPGTSERVYRSVSYVLDRCTWLAEQLRAIESGGDPADVPERWIPALGFDARTGGA